MYQIFYKNIPVFEIDTESVKGSVNIFNNKYLPFSLGIKESDDFDDRFNNLINFNAWCSKRVLPLDREYAKEILNYYGYSQGFTDAERSKIAIECRCLSLNDCFWLKASDERITWEDVNLFKNSLKDAVFEVALFGITPTITGKELATSDLTTDGKAPKAWQRLGDEFYLLKGDKNDSVNKETEASQILDKLGFRPVVYTKETFDGRPVSKSRCFTDDRTNLVKAEWFNIWCMNHDLSISDFIERFRTQFDLMILADYLVGNSDEHSLNWGFLYDNDFNILGLNPLMDLDHAFESSPASPCLPMRFLGNNMTQPGAAVDVLTRHPEWLSGEMDLSGYKYGAFVEERIRLLQKELGTDLNIRITGADDLSSDDPGL